MTDPGLYGNINASIPPQAFEVEMSPVRQDESIFHPIKALKDILFSLDRIARGLDLIYKQHLFTRSKTDSPKRLGSTVDYSIDYLGHRYVYALSNVAVTLLINGTTQLALTANKWTNVSLPSGTKVTIYNGSDTALQVVTFRACDMQEN
jgi:hypothetical protein